MGRSRFPRRVMVGRRVRRGPARPARSAARLSSASASASDGQVEQHGAVEGGGELDGQHVQVDPAEAQLREQHADMDLGHRRLRARPVWAGCRPGRRGRCRGARPGSRPGRGRRRSVAPGGRRRGPAAAARTGPARWKARSSSSSSAWKIPARVPNRRNTVPLPSPARSASPSMVSRSGPCSASIWRAVASRCSRLRAASARSAGGAPQITGWFHGFTVPAEY